MWQKERREVAVDDVDLIERRDQAHVAVWAHDDDSAFVLVDAELRVPTTTCEALLVLVVHKDPARKRTCQP